MKNRLSYIIISIVFFAAVALSPIALALLPKSDFSENENRALASFPEFSFSSLANGSYNSKVEEYTIDHFPARDFFVGLKTKFELFLSKKEINGVYVCKNGYYMDVYNKPQNTKTFIDNVNELDSSLETADVQLILVPTACRVYCEYLPENADCYDQLKTIDDVYSSVSCRKIDVASVLFENKDSRKLYYKLDHHWTTGAAYLAYAKYCLENGLVCEKESDFDIVSVTDSFKGTTFSKVNDYSAKGESIERYDLPGLEVKVTYDDTGETSDSMYAPEYLEKKDKYSFFLNNLHYLLTIENENAKTNEEIVVVKDSYANCFIPFLASQYKKIYVIDPRNYNDVISDFVNEHESVKTVLVLYNVGTLDTDSGVANIF